MDATLKKQVLRKMTYGMWVLATGTGDDIEASSVTWTMQMSFTPPLVAVAIKADSRLAQMVEKNGAFALHMLDKDQKDVANAFIKPTTVADGKIAGVAFHAGPATGSPLLDGFAAITRSTSAKSSMSAPRGSRPSRSRSRKPAGRTAVKPLCARESG
jgi:flavin reductase (DIM6/NTAB) family NADH-FMN oxidoreductase RutF